MKKEFLISSILIILSFFLGYIYKFYEDFNKIEKLKNRKYYINIKKNKNSLKIKNPYKNIIIFLGEKKLFNNEKIILNKKDDF